MPYYRHILLDLDGTITDPMIGITKSVEFALNHFGIKVNELKELCPFIGPPLKDSFKEFYDFNDQESEIAISKYRERYAEIGIYENFLYKDITDFLKQAGRKGKQLYVATSKPTFFAEKILIHFDLLNHFTFVGGSGLDGARNTKSEVIRYVLDKNNISELHDAVMIGDRKHDIIGAQEVGIDSIGVLYGYGSYEELSQAGANYIVKNIAELTQLLEI